MEQTKIPDISSNMYKKVCVHEAPETYPGERTFCLVIAAEETSCPHAED